MYFYFNQVLDQKFVFYLIKKKNLVRLYNLKVYLLCIYFESEKKLFSFNFSSYIAPFKKS